MSYTAQPGGIASRATARVSAPVSSFCAITAPVGSTSLAPAFAMSCRARSSRSSSTSEVPVSRPMARKKVQAMAPPSRMASVLGAAPR